MFRKLHRYYRQKTEEHIFLSLCSDYDRSLLLGTVPMHAYDFKRLFYIVQSINFISYSFYLSKKFPRLLNENYKEILDELESPTFNPKDDDKIYQEWLYAFYHRMSFAQKFCFKKLLSSASVL